MGGQVSCSRPMSDMVCMCVRRMEAVETNCVVASGCMIVKKA